MFDLITLILSQVSRWFFLSREFFIIPTISLSLVSLLGSKLFVSRKFLYYISLTWAIWFIVFLRFSSLPTAPGSILILTNASLLKLVLMFLLVYKSLKQTNLKPNYADIFDRLILASCCYAALEYLLYCLGLRGIASILDPSYEIVGNFPFIRVNSFWAENQHFSEVLVFYLLSKKQINTASLKALFTSNPNHKWSEKHATLILAHLFLLISNSTTGYFLYAGALLISVLCSFRFTRIKARLRIPSRVSKRYAIALSTLLVIISLVVMQPTVVSKQTYRAQSLITLLTGTDIESSGSKLLRRDVSYQKFQDFLSDQTIPEYDQAEASVVYKDGLLLNLIRFGYVGSFIASASFLAPLAFAHHSYKIEALTYFALMLTVFWLKGETPIAASFQTSMLMSSYFIMVNSPNTTRTEP